MTQNNNKSLRAIVKWQLIILILTVILKFVNKYYLDQIVFFILNYPGNEVNDLLWWQKYNTLERFGWYIIDYIENRHSI